MSETERPYDAFLLVSFGGPEGPDDVMPFLENVTRGRGIPPERLLGVAEHYHHFGGKSPINDHCRALRDAVEAELGANGPELPVYWGNRHWHPFLADTLRKMRDDGVRRAIAFVTSSFSSFSGCRQYVDAIEAARAEVGEGAPVIEKLRQHWNHPLFLDAVADRLRVAFDSVPAEARDSARIVFTAHSIPNAMAATSAYAAELDEAAGLVLARLGRRGHDLVYQSRSGPPQVPWLEPDVLDHLEALAREGVRDVVLVPIGFLSDHMEVVWDLDHDAKAKAESVGLRLVRAGTVGTHPAFVSMIGELVRERTAEAPPRAEGTRPPCADVCPATCCAYVPARPGGRPPMSPERQGN